MAQASSVWHLAVVGLAGLLRARPGFRTPGVATTSVGLVPVYVGPQIRQTEDPQDYLSIGSAGDDDEIAGSFTQRIATIGRPRTRDEAGATRCLAAAQSGDLDTTKSMNRAFALLDEVDAVLRRDATAVPDLGVPAATGIPYTLGQLDGASTIRWTTDSRGPRCELEFTVTYDARI